MRVPAAVLRMHVGRMAAAACLALALVLAPAKPAQAGLGACVDALEGTVELADYLVGQAGAIAGCGDKMTFSPPATAAVGVLIGLVYAAGQFNDEQTCKNLVNSTISKMLATLLNEAPKVKAALEAALDQIPGVNGKEAVAKLIAEAGTQAAEELSKLPGLDRIFGLMNCTCTVLGTGIETLKRTKEIANETGQCIGAVGEAYAESIEWMHCNVFGTCLVAGVQQQACDPIQVQCAPGQDTKDCIAWAKLTSNFTPAEWSFCSYDMFCPDPKGSGTITMNLSAKTSFPDQPGNGIFDHTGRQHCPCANGQALSITTTPKCIPCTGPGKEIVNDLCQTWTCAPEKPGKKLVSLGSYHLQCNYESTCGWNTVWNDEKNACSLCGANEVWTGSLSSTGAVIGADCKPCAYDEFKPDGSSQMNCMKLQCTGLSHPDKNDPHKCVACKSVFNVKGVSLGASLNKKFGSKPVCLDQVEEAAKKPCPGGTARYPDGSCRKPPKALEVVKVKVGPGPQERISNPTKVKGETMKAKRQGPVTGETALPKGQTSSKKKTMAPSLDDIGTSLTPGSRAPGATSAPSLRTAPVPR